LHALSKVLDKFSIERNVALDFGSGSGDFSRLLSSMFLNVISFDISDVMKNLNQDKNRMFKNIEFYSGNFEENINLNDGTLNLILSVTVLGHLMDEKVLNNYLNFFYQKLKSDGLIIAFEYTPENSMNPSEYQRFLTFLEWKKIFNNNNFDLVKAYGFYSPSESPVNSFKQYKSNFSIKWLNYFKMFEFAKKRISKIARKYVLNSEDYFWNAKDDDLMKIMIFKKQITI
jgi:SAM-dependent methyltransferase